MTFIRRNEFYKKKPAQIDSQMPLLIYREEEVRGA
jgi:hypothetical protein